MNGIDNGAGVDDVIIRNERPDEWPEVEELTREAFWNVNMPGCLAGGAWRYVESDAYHIDEAAAERFDFGFEPKKKKSYRPSQESFYICSRSRVL